MKIIIPDVPPTLNALMRLHWTELRRVQNNWYTKIRFAGRYENSFSDAEWQYLIQPIKRYVCITRYAPRLLDYDRFVGSCTIVVDALKSRRLKKVGKRMMMLSNSGLIYDDNPEYLRIEYIQVRAKTKKLVIEIL